MIPAAASAPSERGWMRVPIALIACGLVVGAVCSFLALGPIFRTLLWPKTMDTPGSSDLELSAGTYMVFERTGSQRGGGGFTFDENSGTSLSTEAVRVIAPDGSAVPTEYPSSNETITRGSATYTGAVSFDVPVRGRYQVVVRSSVGQVLVARSLADTLGATWGWFVGAVLCGIIVLVGVIVLIVRASRRRRQRPSYGGPPPPDWYPDPEGVSRLRYWDGRMWTEHRA